MRRYRNGDSDSRDWHYLATPSVLDAISVAKPNFEYVQVSSVDDAIGQFDSLLPGKRVTWLLNNNHVVWIDVDKILFMEGNLWNFGHAKALFNLIKSGQNPVLELPAARVYRIDRSSVKSTVDDFKAGQLGYQQGMSRPWDKSDVGSLRAQLLDGNHRALAAIAAGEEKIPVIVGEHFWPDIKAMEWIKGRPGLKRAKNPSGSSLFVWDPAL